MNMNEAQGETRKKTAKALGALIVLGISARWAPTLASLLVIVVVLNYARYAWHTIAKIPPRQLAELIAVAATALGVGFLAKLGTAPLILTGLFLLVALPLWRLARHDPREERGTGGEPDSEPEAQ
jgi:hypothetical protein